MHIINIDDQYVFKTKSLYLNCYNVNSTVWKYLDKLFLKSLWLNTEDLTVLNDPENENYWDVWEHVLNTAYFEITGKKYSLYHDGDLLAICYDSLTDEEKDNLGFDNF